MAFIPYMGNFALAGLTDDDFTEAWLEHFEAFYQDKDERLGIIDKILDEEGNLTPVAKALADSWFGTVRKLGECQDNTWRW